MKQKTSKIIIVIIVGLATLWITPQQSFALTPCTSNASCNGLRWECATPTSCACVAGNCIPRPPKSTTTNIGSDLTLGDWISRIVDYLLPVFGMIGFLFFIWSGIQFLMSKGEPKGIAAAQARLTYAIVGLVIIFLAFAIEQVVKNIFGFR